MKAINKDKVIMAEIFEPYENSGEPWDSARSHGWQVRVVLAANPGDIDIIVDVEDRECAKRFMTDSLGLILT